MHVSSLQAVFCKKGGGGGHRAQRCLRRRRQSVRDRRVQILLAINLGARRKSTVRKSSRSSFYWRGPRDCGCFEDTASFQPGGPYCMVKPDSTVKKVLFIAALYAVLCASCIGQDQSSALSAGAAKTSAQKGQISGQVLDSSTGQP